MRDQGKAEKGSLRQRWAALAALARGRALVIAGALFAAIFTLLTAAVLEADLQPTWWDTELTRLFQNVPREPWGELLIWVSAPGFPPWNWSVPFAAVLLLAIARRFWDAAFMALASLGGLTAGLVKIVLDRRPPLRSYPRPRLPALLGPNCTGFPSQAAT